MLQRKKKSSVIPAQKMALLAEKGLNAARLSRTEMLTLANGGLNELYSIKEGIKSPPPPVDTQLIEQVMAAYFPAASIATPARFLKDISVRLTKNAVSVIAKAFDWQLNSPAFAQRGPDSGSVSFCKETGKFTIHLEFIKSRGRQAGINVRLTEKSKQDRTSFEATLFQDGQCIESVHATKNPVASFSTICPGDYLLKVSDKKKVIVSVEIRLVE